MEELRDYNIRLINCPAASRPTDAFSTRKLIEPQMAILVGDPLSQVDVCRHILSIQVAQTGSENGNCLAVISVLAADLNVLSALLEVLASPFK